MADITYSKPTWVNGSTVPISAANLQAISDAVDAVAHKANRGAAILDADTVSGYGIGVTTGNVVGDFDGVTKGGNYYCGLGCTGSPTNGYYSMVHTPFDGPTTWVQEATNISTGEKYKRFSSGGSKSAWYKVWDALSDGNGGQPPMARPNLISDTTIGYSGGVDVASGAALTLPAGGTFYVRVETYGANYAGANMYIANGGVQGGSASANCRIQYTRLS